MTVVDNRTRECLALIADTALSAVLKVRVTPQAVFSHRAAKFTSNATFNFVHSCKFEWHYIAP